MRRCALCLAVALLAGGVASGSGAAEPLTPAAVKGRLQARLDGLTDYQCVLRTETKSGTRVERGEFQLWYRRPGYLRLRVVEGRRRGSEFVMGVDGTLRGRHGGLLRAFSRRLSRGDPSLRSLRGQPAWELDFGSFLRAMEERMSQPGSRSILHPAGGGDPEVILEVRYRSPGGEALRDIWGIDPRDWLLRRGDVFEGDQRVDHVEFTNIRTDVGLKESWFRF
jgi:outer membrane lipoprotein-sorting protein